MATLHVNISLVLTNDTEGSCDGLDRRPAHLSCRKKRGGEINTVMEAWKSHPDHLPAQELLSYKLLVNSCCWYSMLHSACSCTQSIGITQIKHGMMRGQSFKVCFEIYYILKNTYGENQYFSSENM
jgi:hypothetical protein